MRMEGQQETANTKDENDNNNNNNNGNPLLMTSSVGNDDDVNAVVKEDEETNNNNISNIEGISSRENKTKNNTLVEVDDDGGDDDLDHVEDHVILWPPPLKVAPVDPSRKCDVSKEERQKLTETLLLLVNNNNNNNQQQKQATTKESSEGTTTTTTTSTPPSSSSSSQQEQKSRPSSASSTNTTTIPTTKRRKKRRIVIITGETCHYRSATRSIPSEGNFHGLEIGCAYGDCLSILNKNCITSYGIDKSVECITRLIQRYPKLINNASVVDCFTESDKLIQIIQDHNITVCCLDIGGDRHAEAVFDLINGNALRDIQILIVKARIVYNDGVKIEFNEIQQWWEKLCISRGSQLSIPNWATKQKQQKGKKYANNNNNKKSKTQQEI